MPLNDNDSPLSPELVAALLPYGQMDDRALPLAELALELSLVRYPHTDLTPYRAHLAAIVETASKVAQAGLPADNPHRQLSLLRHVIYDHFGYDGDTNDYDLLDNASLVRVIDRSCGLPVALMILCLHLGTHLNWKMEALNFPGHVYGRLSEGGESVLFDPFDRADLVHAHDLRQALKRVLGPSAELSATYYTPMTRREIAVRLQNNLKIRLLERGQEAEALAVVEATRLIAPAETRLCLDAGILYARNGQRNKAQELLEQYLQTLRNPAERAEILALLGSLHDGPH